MRGGVQNGIGVLDALSLEETGCVRPDQELKEG